MDPVVQRIYDIKVQGYQEALKNLQALTSAFEKMDTTKRRLDENLKKAIEAGNTSAIEKLTGKIKELEGQLKNLDKQRQQSAREVELLAKAEKLEADAAERLATARKREAEADLAAAKAAQVRQGSLIQQERELDRLIALEEKKKKLAEQQQAQTIGPVVRPVLPSSLSGFTISAGVSANTKAAEDSLSGLKAKLKDLEKEYDNLSKSDVNFESEQKRITEAITRTAIEINQLNSSKKQAKQVTDETTQSLKIEVGSYRDVLNQMRELRPFVQNTSKTSTATVNFQGQLLGIEQATQKFKELSAAEQAFRRQFAKDGTLVGEYTTGILQAFNKLGLTDVIKKQRNDINTELRRLRDESSQLANQLKKTGDVGSEAFEKIERQLRDNIQLQEQLGKSLNSIDAQLVSTGSVTSQISKSISENFKNVKQQIGSLALAYVGFQGAITSGSKLVSLNFDFQDTANELRSITGVAGKDFEFLKQKAQETSDQTKYSSIEILESFKLIASAKPELLQDVEGLNQVKDAAVKLAQASGQTLPEAVDSLTKVLNQFGADASQSSKYIDALAAGAKFGAAEIPNITSALLEFGTQAKSSNISVQESVGLIELLGEKGIQGAEAGTKLRNILLAINAADALPRSAKSYLISAGVDIQKLSDTSLSLEDRLTELGKVANDNAALVKIFGKENFNAGQIVLQNIPRYSQLADQSKTLGVAQEQATINTNSASVAWGKFFNQLKNIATSDNVTSFLAGLAGVLSFFAGNLQLTIPLIIVSIGLTNTLAGSILRLSASYALQASAWIVERAQLIATNAVKAAAATITNIYTAAIIRSNAASGAAAIAYRLLAAAIALFTSPLGIAIGLVAAFTTVIGIFSSRAGEASAATAQLTLKQRELNEQQKLNTELQGEVQKQTSATKDRINELIAVIKSSTATDKEKEQAYRRLIAIAPDYLSGLTQENILTQEGQKIIDRYIQSLDQLADAKARNNLKTRLKEQLLETQNTVASLKQEQSQAPEISGVRKFFLGADGKFFGSGDRNRYDIDQDLQKKQAEEADINRKLLVLDQSNNQLIEQLRKSIETKRKTLQSVKQGSDEAKKLSQDIASDESTLFALQGITPQQPTAGTGGAAGDGSETQGLAELKQELERVNKAIAEIDKVKNKTAEQKARLQELRKQKAEILKEIRELGGSTKNTPAYGGAKLTGEQKDVIRDIDAVRDGLLADEKLKRSKNEIDEITYLNNILRINQDAIDKKLAFLKGANAEERKQISELRLDRITQEQETNNKIFELRKQSLKNTLDERIKSIEEENRKIQEDPSISATNKAEIKKQSDEAILLLQLKFQKDMDVLEKQYGQQSLKNAKETAEAVRKTKEQLQKDEQELLLANLKDIQEEGDRAVAKTRKTFAQIRVAVAESNLSDRKKAKATKELDKQETNTVLTDELKSLERQLPVYQALLNAKLVTEQQYNEFLKKLFDKRKEIVDGDNQFSTVTATLPKQGGAVDLIKTLAKGKISVGKDKDGKDVDGSELLGNILAESYNVAQQAMQSYFEAERAEVEKSKQLAYKRIDLMKEQALAQAQTQEEKDTIEKKAQAQKEKADREAGEKLKKIKKSEAKVALATELANIAVAAAQNPLNGITLGAAGIAMYAALAGLAFARYAINVRNIDAQQFAGGGQVKPKNLFQKARGFFTGGQVQPAPLTSGKIAVPSNIPVQPNGDDVLATVKVGEVILNERQQRALGGAATFRKIGVPGFADGGVVQPFFGGLDLGESLQAPINPQAFLKPNNSNADLSEVKEMLKQQTLNLQETARQIHSRIDKIKVQVVASEVETVNANTKKAKSIGTL